MPSPRRANFPTYVMGNPHNLGNHHLAEQVAQEVADVVGLDEEAVVAMR